MGTIIKNTTSAFVDGQQITSDALNNLIDDAILNTTAVSAGTGLTVNASTGVLSMDTSLTGKTLTGGSLNNCPIGASTPNTGSFTTLTASGDVNFDSNTLFVDASADTVGIGTTSPAEKLEVVGNAILDATDARLKIKSGTTGTEGGVYWTFNTDSTTYGKVDLPWDTRTSVGLRMKSASGYAITIDSGNGILFGEDGTAHSAFDTVGNLGIGNTSPAAKLDVRNDGADVSLLRLSGDQGSGAVRDMYIKSPVDSNTNNPFRFTTSNSFSWEIDSTEAMRVDQVGNVGIGTITPSSTLDVTGTLAVSDDANFDSGTLFVDASANRVGVGTTSPSAPLQVNAPGIDGILLRQNVSTNPTGIIEVRGQRSDTNNSQACGGGIGLTRWSSGDQIVDGNAVGSIYFGGAHGSTTADEANILYTASIKAEADETWSSSSNMATDLVFRTGSTGRAYAYNQSYGDLEVMRITHEGNVDIVNDLTAATITADGDTSAGDKATMGYTATEGLILTGQGSSNDVTIKNDADVDVAHIPTGTTRFTFDGVAVVNSYTTAQISALPATAGGIVFDSDTGNFAIADGTNWKVLAGGPAYP